MTKEQTTGGATADLTTLLAVVTGLAVWTLMRQEIVPADLMRFSLVASPDIDLEGLHNDLVISPFFSPDGEWLAFASDGILKKVTIRGGPSVTICALPGGIFGGGAWTTDDTIVIGRAAGGLLQVSGSGGEPRPFLELGEDEVAQRLPDVLPGGQAVLFTSVTGTILRPSQIAVHSFETGERRVLSEGSDPLLLPTGHVVFGRAEALWAAPFDLDRLALSGEAVPVVEGVRTTPSTGTQAAISRDGSLVYAPSLNFGDRTLVWVDRSGREEPLPTEPRAYLYPRISPDEQSVALSVFNPYDIWSWSFARQTLERLTFEEATIDAYSIWSSDGRTFVFASDRGGAMNLFQRATDGTGSVDRLTESPNSQRPSAISRDGRWLLFTESVGVNDDLFRLSLEDPDRPPESLVQTEFDERNAEISPDGRWLAYESNPSGEYQVFVRPFEAAEGGPQQVSSDGGRMPLWSRDGRELLYWEPGGRMMAVQVEAQSQMTLPRPHVLFEGRYYEGVGSSFGRTFDISADGERFLMVKDSQRLEPLRVVQHWFQELTERVPVN